MSARRRARLAKDYTVFAMPEYVLIAPAILHPGERYWMSGPREEAWAWKSLGREEPLERLGIVSVYNAVHYGNKEGMSYFEEASWLAGAAGDGLVEAQVAQEAAAFYLAGENRMAANADFFFRHGTEALVATINTVANYLLRCGITLPEIRNSVKGSTEYPKLRTMCAGSERPEHWPDAKDVRKVLKNAGVGARGSEQEQALLALERIRGSNEVSLLVEERALAFHRHRTGPFFVYGMPLVTWDSADGAGLRVSGLRRAIAEEEAAARYDEPVAILTKALELVMNEMGKIRAGGEALRDEFVSMHEAELENSVVMAEWYKPAGEQLGEVLSQWDPAKLASLSNRKNEYKGLLTNLIHALLNGAHEVEISDALHSMVVDHFGIVPRQDQTLEAARSICDCWLQIADLYSIPTSRPPAMQSRTL